MNGTVITAVVLALGLAVGMALAVRGMRRHRDISVEDRGRRAITELAIDRGRRQVWGAASIGIIAAGTEFTTSAGTGCGGGSNGGCAGSGCGGGGGCGGGCGG